MWTIQDLKAKGKTAFKKNYWACVGVAFLAFLIDGGLSGVRSYKDIANRDDMGNSSVFSGFNTPEALAVLAFLMIVIIIAIIIGFVLRAFLINPLLLGCNKFFIENRNSSSQKANIIGFGFKSNYGNIVKVMIVKDIFVFLWTLLFIVPGIIKAYEYRLTPYLLAENPDMDWKEALDRSKMMMDGQKWNSFLLDMSFIGWIILTVVSFGIVGIFYAYPYILATDVELYFAISRCNGGDMNEDPFYNPSGMNDGLNSESSFSEPSNVQDVDFTVED